MRGATGTIFIVDDDEGTRMGLSRLLMAAGYRIRLFESAESFLKEQDVTTPGCLLLDVCLPGLSGLELQRLLTRSPDTRPIIFLTGMNDVQDGVLAMKQGAVDFLTKPIDSLCLFAAVERALQRDCEQRCERAVLEGIQRRVDTLTPRERVVMEHVVHGRLNKQIAWQFGVHEKTVKVHRARVMHKLGASSIAELARLAMRIGISIERLVETGVEALKSPDAPQRAAAASSSRTAFVTNDRRMAELPEMDVAQLGTTRKAARRALH